MKLKDLYSKPINRAVNPAVSATKFDPETERIEIQEYVFTDEITMVSSAYLMPSRTTSHTTM